MNTKTRRKKANTRLIKLLDEYHVQSIALHPLDDQDLVHFFRSQATWSVDSADEILVLFTRTNPVSSSEPPVKQSLSFSLKS